ncbi:MAG: sodium:proton antiporter NhaD [Bacteroidota bacterium]|nr:sodium:proton antiporter NhaD [Bacteroidota bacterium]MDP3145316.1 sodium:proton antiporter NhaD [Bacteroidota bacterium]MDP3557615.1 sodium:proton antiporter NhaD [Bacteroidota bacterium]
MLSTLLIVVFIISYSLIAFEHKVNINKAAVALFSGVLCWIFVMIYSNDPHILTEELMHHFSEIAAILFFLLGAMTIVELIDAHNGFDIITQQLIKVKPITLIWLVAAVAFILSAVLDNLTSTILIISLLRKILPEGKLRLLFAGLVVIAANAGGAFSPIGDVTTTMLWIGGQVSTTKLITSLIVPSIINLLVPLVVLFFIMKKQKLFQSITITKIQTDNSNNKGGIFILILGLLSLIAVPIFKVIFHLPPFMGILFGLGLMWCITEIKDGRRVSVDKKNYSVAFALRNIDTPSILFFLGILLSISALQTSGVLHSLAAGLNSAFSSENTILVLTGFMSAIIDNVPLVAAYQGMYTFTEFAADSSFWHLLAYSSGTGGSMLIIGSAAGVVAMGIENISFTWYLKNISWLAVLGYLSGFGVYLITT